MNIAKNKSTIEAFCRLGSEGNLEGCLALMDDDVKWRNIGSTRFSGTFVGKERLITDLLGPLFSQLRSGLSSTVENVVAEGDYVVLQSRGKAQTTEGKDYNNTYCHIFKIRDGRIVEVTEYFDTELVTSVFGR
jgi:uncharacterized protein